jgi:hypothetical protein
MPKNKSKWRSLEEQIIEIVRQSPLKPGEVEERVATERAVTSDAVHEKIISMVDQGLLKVTLDMKLGAADRTRWPANSVARQPLRATK